MYIVIRVFFFSLKEIGSRGVLLVGLYAIVDSDNVGAESQSRVIRSLMSSSRCRRGKAGCANYR